MLKLPLLTQRISFYFIVVIICFVFLLYLYFSTFNDENKELWWGDVVNIYLSLFLGFITSCFTYYLTVYLPNENRKNIVKEITLKNYLFLKKNLLRQIIWGSIEKGRNDLSVDNDTIDRLLDPREFEKEFRGGKEANEGFYAFENYFDASEENWHKVVSEIKLIRHHISPILNLYALEDLKNYDFYRRLDDIVIRMETLKYGTDDYKVISRFIFEMYAGYHKNEEYIYEDIIEEMIKNS
jgi:hypothetical protein